MATTRTIPCPRCGGRGTVCNGACFLCWGSQVHTFTVYTATEKADLKARGTRRIAAITTVREHAAKLDTHLGLTSIDDRYADWAFWGFSRLEENDTNRYAKMLDSIDNGRIYDVIRALADYAKAYAN